MVTTVSYTKNMKAMFRKTLASIPAGPDFLELDPHQIVGIAVDKDGNEVLVEGTFDTINPDGTPLVDLEASTVNWFPLSTGTGNYFAGDNLLLSGVQITFLTDNGNDVNYTVSQVSPT